MLYLLFVSCVSKAPGTPAESTSAFDGMTMLEIASSNADVPVSAEDVPQTIAVLWKQHCAEQQANGQRIQERERQAAVHSESSMRYSLKQIGEKPADGYPLYIALHGGGGAPAYVNDQQWNHMKIYYRDSVKTGIYVAARGISNNWNLHFESKSYPLYDRLIDNLMLWGEIDPNRVYFLGFSAGGDGIYQIAPRMSDRIAGANMSAGHPNGTSPINLYTVPFSIQMGALDAAYNRNKVAAQYALGLQTLQNKHPKGYKHELFLHHGGAHSGPWRDNDPRQSLYPVLTEPQKWLDGQGSDVERRDSNAIRWLSKHRRNPHPTHLIWNTQTRADSRGARAKTHYWLQSDDPKGILAVRFERNTFTIEEANVDFRILIDPTLVDIEAPVKVEMEGRVLFEGKMDASLQTMAKSIRLRNDPTQVYIATIEINLPKDANP